MQQINTMSQHQTAGTLVDWLNRDLIWIRKSSFNYHDDRKILLFQLFSKTENNEICILQQIIYPGGAKSVHIYFNAHERNFDKNIIQNLIDIVNKKSQ